MARIVPRSRRRSGPSCPGSSSEPRSSTGPAGCARTSATFASLIGKLEQDLLDQVVPDGGGLGKATMALANRWVTTRQLGYLLGFMGPRVLGQYDLALLSAEAEPGRLLFVEENIRATARALGIPVEPFRTWIALHETTHAFEFEAHPWLRPYLAERLERQLRLFGERRLDARPRRAARPRTRAARRGWRRALDGTADGRRAARLFRETQAVMSLLEGFSDYVMDEVGQGLVPDVERISARFHERRARTARRSSAPILRLTGMDLKLEQYAKGEGFVRAIAEARGPAALARLWEGPETLPRDGEIDEPDAGSRGCSTA